MLQPPVIAVTLGEPAGVGPEIALRAAWELRREVSVLLVGDWPLLNKLADNINPDIVLRRLTQADLPRVRQLCEPNTLLVMDCPLTHPVRPGHPDPANAPSLLKGLDLAISGTTAGQLDAIATAPIQKSAINAAGIPFTGHTEYLAERTKTGQVVMMLAGKITPPNAPASFLRVALATTHLPLRKIADAITIPSLLRTLHILHRECQEKFAIPSPRILVSGLNPHAGENGYLGTEEQETLIPAIQAAQKQGIHASGPFPADTLFLPHNLSQADCFLAMYHDQGLPVLKYATFGRGINITLGLPIIRTSADHGTALDLAEKGTGLADHGSMKEAILTAAEMASRTTATEYKPA
ncbi:MAG: 4-hydroxythreonine-4-phosphate dehydrogenase PdxA [Alistipes senegalensis]|nr:4-hydroxythreonine-4-phosphate dehydrogenase PdxA [Oxalobacter formigenes]MCM1281871.1 4-hydroxythreonine-4-phosphate dehydrogenase PdxA [Alistipes senegalensis]